MVREAGFWANQEGPTGMHLGIEEHEPAEDGTVAFWWWMEEAASAAPYDLEVSARGYFASREDAYEDAQDFAESHNFEVFTSREEACSEEEE